MKKEKIQEILLKLSKNEITPEKAFESLKDLPYKDLGYAKLDHHREIRKGMPEAIYCPGKTPQQVISIFKEMKKKSNVIATKASPEIMKIVAKNFPKAEIHKDAGIIFLGEYPKKKKGRVVVLTGGTSDIPVAMESVVILKAMGVGAEAIFDVGVAGVHRLLSFIGKLKNADVIIVAAGMDGALPSVVAGLVSAPVVAVPTSVGYGASFSGLAPLLTMLNSCASGVVVVNIDNGYGAGYFAGLIAKREHGK